MIREPLSKPVQNIVHILRTMINENEATEERKAVHSWKYGGAKFLYGINQLKATLESEGKKINECKAMHFARGANIITPSRRLVLIPLNGNPTLGAGTAPLGSDSLYCVEEAQLYGEHMDIIFVVLSGE